MSENDFLRGIIGQPTATMLGCATGGIGGAQAGGNPAHKAYYDSSGHFLGHFAAQQMQQQTQQQIWQMSGAEFDKAVERVLKHKAPQPSSPGLEFDQQLLLLEDVHL